MTSFIIVFNFHSQLLSNSAFFFFFSPLHSPEIKVFNSNVLLLLLQDVLCELIVVGSYLFVFSSTILFYYYCYLPSLFVLAGVLVFVDSTIFVFFSLIIL